jgi:hypothetical protein
MNVQIYNACITTAWFMLTLGGILYRLDVGLMIGGVSLAALTLFVMLRYGLYHPQKVKKVDDNVRDAAHEDARPGSGVKGEQPLRLI